MSRTVWFRTAVFCAVWSYSHSELLHIEIQHKWIFGYDIRKPWGGATVPANRLIPPQPAIFWRMVHSMPLKSRPFIGMAEARPRGIEKTFVPQFPGGLPKSRRKP